MQELITFIVNLFWNQVESKQFWPNSRGKLWGWPQFEANSQMFWIYHNHIKFSQHSKLWGLNGICDSHGPSMLAYFVTAMLCMVIHYSRCLFLWLPDTLVRTFFMIHFLHKLVNPVPFEDLRRPSPISHFAPGRPPQATVGTTWEGEGLGGSSSPLMEKRSWACASLPG